LISTFHSPGVMIVGTSIAGVVLASSHASPNARLTASRLFHRAGKESGFRISGSGTSAE
jgi:hypothetical protein